MVEPLLGEQPTAEALAEWVVKTCLTFGTTVATAYQVAGLFVLGVTKENGHD